MIEQGYCVEVHGCPFLVPKMHNNNNQWHIGSNKVRTVFGSNINVRVQKTLLTALAKLFLEECLLYHG